MPKSIDSSLEVTKQSIREIKSVFVKLKKNNWRVSSAKTERYNCMAFAVEDTGRCWWPQDHKDAYWPEDLPKDETPDTFIKVFQLLGYEVCENFEHELGYEKVVLYVKEEKVKHVAKQVSQKKWKSKLGPDHDIEHQTPKELEGNYYGKVYVVLRKKTPN